MRVYVAAMTLFIDCPLVTLTRLLKLPSNEPSDRFARATRSTSSPCAPAGRLEYTDRGVGGRPA